MDEEITTSTKLPMRQKTTQITFQITCHAVCCFVSWSTIIKKVKIRSKFKKIILFAE